jgi:aminopeptidase N
MLRTLLYMLALLLLMSAPVVAAGPGLMNQELFIRLDPAEHHLHGKAVLTLADGQTEWPADFRLASQAAIDAVTVDGEPVPYAFTDGILQLDLARSTTILTVVYRVRFDDLVPQDTVGIEDPSLGVMATIQPQGTYLSEASAWHPRPLGTNSLFRVTISGPPGLTGVTAGRLVASESGETGTQTTWQTRLPQAALALAAGAYQLSRDNLGDIQLLIFTGAENAALAAGYLASCREYLQLYQQLFGPYPYAKFAVVENFYPTGYGLSGWTLLGSSVIRLPFIRTTSLPHEIAHAWWGNAIEIDYQSGNWGEGLATYVADYYLKELHDPAEALEYRRNILRDYKALVTTGDDLPLRDFRIRTTKRDQAVGYGKAAMVFHMLRTLIGDQAFWSGLQAAARQGLGRRYSWRDLQRHFEAASGLQLTSFFRQWIDHPGAPRLRLADVSARPMASGWEVSGTLGQDEPLYALSVPLRLETATQSLAQSVVLTEREQGFSFTVSERPRNLVVDPQSSLFRQLYAEELPATVNNLRASRAPLVVVAKGSEALLGASRDLLRGLQWQQAPVLSEAEYLARRPGDHDLLVLGWPENTILQPMLPTGISVAGQKFVINDKLYAEADDVLFLVLAGHENPHVAGYFLPGSVAAAQDTARRIPHYGRYSSLVFSNGQNQVKSTWEPARSPLKIFFAKEASP